MADSASRRDQSDREQPSQSEQKYLKAIHRLGGDQRKVHTGRLAQRLKIRPPSVTEMLRRLDASGWIDYEIRTGILLTKIGIEKARRAVRRHRLLELFLYRVLGVDWSEVHAEAESIEFSISETLERRISDFLGNPTEDPHGHSIPTVSGSMETNDWQSLADIETGSAMLIREASDDDATQLRRWQSLGLILGATVRMTGKTSSDTNLQLEVGANAIEVARSDLVGLLGEAQ